MYAADRRPLRVGYACRWWEPRAATWSYSAARLRSAFDATPADVVDIEAQRSLLGKVALRAACALRPGTPWQYSGVEAALVDRAVRAGARRHELDAVLGIAEVDTPTDVPTFAYQDMNTAVALAHRTASGWGQVAVLPARDAVLERMAARQLERYGRLRGTFTMSRWFADELVAQGVDPARVHPVGGGINNLPIAVRPPDAPVRDRLLFVGVEMVRKGGDLVVEAARRLRRAGRQVTLTVAGPDRWPLPEPPPDWVRFLGRVPGEEVSALYADHDLFVLPSRYEAFGVVFLEAQLAGLPCIARDAFAMPELVVDGVTGLLVRSDEPDELAALVDRALTSPLYEGVAAARPGLLARHRWEAIATAMLAVMEREAR